MADRVIQRNDTAARWQSINPVLAQGELGIVSDGAKGYKIGDGVTAWNNLEYPANPASVVQGLGNSETAVISQKVVTETFNTKANQDSIKAIYEGTEGQLIGYYNNSTALAGGGTRVHNHPVVGYVRLIQLKLHSGGTGPWVLYKYIRNPDGTFNEVGQIISGTAIVGENIIDLSATSPVEDGTYLGMWFSGSICFYDIQGNNSAFTLSAPTGDNIKATADNYRFDWQVEGYSTGMNKIRSDIGDISLLNTTDKTNLVNAINEVKSSTIKSDDSLNDIYEETPFSLGNITPSDTTTLQGYRVFSKEMLVDTHISKITYLSKSSGSFTLYEVTRNEDGTFQYKSRLGSFVMGNTQFYQKTDFIVHKGSYIAYGSSTNSMAYNTNGNGSNYSIANWSEVNPMPATIDNIQLDLILEGEYINIPFLESDIKDVKEGSLYKYGNDYTKTTSSWAGNRTIIDAQIIPVTGYVKKFYCNMSAAGSIDFYMFSRNSNGTFNAEDFLTSAIVSVGLNEIDTNVKVKSGMYIGVYIPEPTAGIYWDNGGACVFGTGFYGMSKNISITASSAKLSIGADIEVTGLEETVEVTQKPLRQSGILLDTSIPVPSLVDDGNWGGFSCDTPNSYLYLNKTFGADRFVDVVNFRCTLSASKIVVCQPYGGFYVSVNLENKRLTIHNTWTGNVSDTEPTIATWTNITIPIIVGRYYNIIVEQDTVETLNVKFIDTYTLGSNILTHKTGANDYNLHGKGTYPLGLILRKGSMQVGRLKVYSKEYTTPTLMIYGDSYCEGYNLLRYGFPIDARYPQLIKDAFNGNVSISCKGGESSTGLLKKIDTDFNMFKPKYTLLAIGINDYLVDNNTLQQYKQNMSIIINKIRANGSEVILTTFPRLRGGGKIDQYNSWIRNYIPFRYLDIQKVTANEDAVMGTPDPQYFLADGHPNVLGNQRIYELFMMNFEDLLSDNN